jgi:hypothetical protein
VHVPIPTIATCKPATRSVGSQTFLAGSTPRGFAGPHRKRAGSRVPDSPEAAPRANLAGGRATTRLVYPSPTLRPISRTAAVPDCTNTHQPFPVRSGKLVLLVAFLELRFIPYWDRIGIGSSSSRGIGLFYHPLLHCNGQDEQVGQLCP